MIGDKVIFASAHPFLDFKGDVYKRQEHMMRTEYFMM